MYALHRSAASFAWFRGARQAIDIDPFGAGALEQACKGFGGGEATRDPAPTVIDPSDPKGKQQAIFKAESFAEYLARREGN